MDVVEAYDGVELGGPFDRHLRRLGSVLIGSVVSFCWAIIELHDGSTGVESFGFPYLDRDAVILKDDLRRWRRLKSDLRKQEVWKR